MSLFDAHATSYDAWYDTALGRYADTVEKGLIGELADPRPDQRALDLGCGTGNYSLWLAARGLRVTGLDESPAMLDIAASKASQAGLGINFVVGNASALPFADRQFDVVVSVATMEFVGAPDRVFREALRVVKPGGRLVLGLLTRDSPWGDLYSRQARQRTDTVFARAHLFTESEILARFGAPNALRRGLYNAPDPDMDPRLAARLEQGMQSLQAEHAGFLAVRWVKDRVEHR